MKCEYVKNEIEKEKRRYGGIMNLKKNDNNIWWKKDWKKKMWYIMGWDLELVILWKWKWKYMRCDEKWYGKMEKIL